MQGNCLEAPSSSNIALYIADSLLKDWRPGQCVIVTDVRLMSVYSSIWLHKLYIRHHSTTRSDTMSVIWCGTEDCNLWMTDVTLQGDGAEDPELGGLDASGGQVYAEGTVLGLCVLFNSVNQIFFSFCMCTTVIKQPDVVICLYKRNCGGSEKEIVLITS